MATTVCLYFRGDGSARALESFRRTIGAAAESLVIHPNRDDTGYYGSADVEDVEAVREAFAQARQPFPTLKAYLGVLPPEREESSPRGNPGRPGEGRGRQHESRAGGGRSGEGRSGNNAGGQQRGGERGRGAGAPRPPEQGERRQPLRPRNRNERREPGDRTNPERDKQA